MSAIFAFDGLVYDLVDYCLNHRFEVLFFNIEKCKKKQ